MKVRVKLELEVPNFSMHRINGVLMEILGKEISDVKVIGAYTDENENPISEDFFIVDENFAQVTEAVLKQKGVPEETIAAFIESDELFALHREWNEYISDYAEANMHGKEKFTELAQKYVAVGAA